MSEYDRFKHEAEYVTGGDVLNNFLHNLRIQANSTHYEKRDLENLCHLLMDDLTEVDANET